MNIFNFEVSTFGAGLFIFGLSGFIFSSVSKRKQSTNTVNANNGSVAVGRDNNAQITTTTNINQNSELQKTKQTYLLDILYVISSIATLIGFGITIAPLISK